MLNAVGSRTAPFLQGNNEEPPVVLPPASAEQVRHYTERAHVNLARVEQHWRDRFGRDGTDGRGRHPSVTVVPDLFNAEANTTSWTVRLGRFGPDSWYADDLGTLNHEYTHLVIFDETTGTSNGRPALWQKQFDQHVQRRLTANGKRNGRVAAAEGRRADAMHMLMNQYRAIHEGIADVMGAALTQDWRGPNRDVQKGAGIITDFRQYKAPVSMHSDPKNSPREAHAAGGIVSDAAVDIQRALGWEAMERIFYEVVIDDRFTDAALFRDVARIAIERASQLYGPEAAAVVKSAFTANYVPTG